MIKTLYVDDEPDLLDIGRLYLERSGDFKVDTELSAKTALEKIRTCPYDIIISDYSMPEMDGIQFLKTIRSHCRNIPFILFTGKSREDVVIDALNSGADYYIQKGGDPKAQFAELHSLIQQAVRRHRIEEELKTSEERYRTIVEDQNEAICRFLPDGTHTFVNEAYCRLVGKTRKELLNKKNPLVVHPDDRDRLIGHLNALSPQKPFGVLNHRIVLPDHSVRLVRCSDRAFFGADKKPREYQSVISDITKEPYPESAYAQALRRFREITDILPDAFFATDRNGNVMVWNKAAAELTGVSETEIIRRGNRAYAICLYGENCSCLIDRILFPHKEPALDFPAINRVGNTLMTRTVLTVRNTMRLHAQIRALPFYGHDGSVIGAVEMITVISGRSNESPGS